MRIVSLPIVILLFFFVTSCEGEAGTQNADAGPDADLDSSSCETTLCGQVCCEEGEECYMGSREPICQTERCRRQCCDASEECVNEMECLPICENTRCGENLATCCAAGEICLDGVARLWRHERHVGKDPPCLESVRLSRNKYGYSNGLWNVPLHEQASWLTYNNYRQNVQGGPLFPVPDLRLTRTAAALCPSEVHLMAVVYNNGSASAPSGTPINFYRTDVDPPKLIASVTTTDTILPGGWERVLTTYAGVVPDTDMTFQATVDQDELIEECDTTNNSATTGPTRCVSVEQTRYDHTVGDIS